MAIAQRQLIKDVVTAMIRLNQAHDIGTLARRMGERRRLQIRDFLVKEDAEKVYDALLHETPWWVALNDGDRVAQIRPEEAAALSREQVAEIMAGVQRRAQVQYQFLYEYYPLYSRYFTAGTPWLPIYEIYEWINSAPALNFFRTILNRPDIRWADGHATLYRAGHFLKYHTDEKPEDQRVAAYVLNFTKGWGRDWGGFLQFFNQDYDVEEGLRPLFNALNIFLIPTDHSVSMVSTYAPGLRFSVTGWLRADEPHGEFNRNGGDYQP
jgi:Rps23 Pro-64 3,4-dihydroxylase Tpa1-like proline 4-hydroxylase